MELKIEQIQLPQTIQFNYEELKMQLATRLSDYKGLVYTEENIKEAKSDRANLNALKKQLNDERIRLEKEYMQPFDQFKTQIRELCDMVDDTSGKIGEQIAEFEEKAKQKKREQIENIFSEVFPTTTWLALHQIFDDKWLNKSVSLKSIKEQIEAKKVEIDEELKAIRRLASYQFEAEQAYKKSLSLTDAIKEADHLKELKIARKDKGIESQKQTFIESVDNSSTEEEKAEIDEDNVHRMWLSFKVLVSPSQAMELAKFLKEHEIEYERA